MAFRDTWHRALVYFGLAEDPRYEDDYYEPETASGSDPYDRPTGGYERQAPRPAPVSRLSERRRSRDEIDDIFADEDASPRTRVLRPVGNGGGGSGADVRVHFVAPNSFNDAQEVADRFKQTVPVILNLQGTEGELAKRLIDFASGLTYALDGGMQRVADKTFLLTPRNVEVSAEERARLVEKGFFNQS
ncbi:cell division protein SepF [Thermoleophilia bacterium SCSIO 60948]|nr:cell division protein SepF [Thermoleophilia bacterium SCSIO 60948]